MVNPIPNPVRTLWDKWNIRGVILTSLFLQIFLILFAPFRKRTDRYPITFSLWSAYLLADCAANFCIGLISDRRDDINAANVHDYILAFWAPFLLLHLGGPDTITAFALEDNELWLRHLLGLIFQLAVTVYVFLLTMPYNNFWIPAVLVFLSGMIKYTERTRSLYLASMNTFRRSMIRDPDAGPNYAKLMEEFASKTEAGIPCSVVVVPEPVLTKQEEDTQTREKLSHVKVVRYAYYYFYKFKGLIVDMIYSSGDRNTSRDFFLSLNAEDAFRVIEVELNFIYEGFFTKDSVLRCKKGYFFRFVSFSCIVAAIVLFTLDQKHGIGRFDVRVSYTLLYGALALDSMALLMLVFSDRTVVRPSDKSQPPDDSAESSHSFKGHVARFLDQVVVPFLYLKEPTWSTSKIYPKFKALDTCWLLRRWSGKVSGHNLIEYCVRKSRKSSFVKVMCEKLIDKIGVKEVLEKCFKKRDPFLWELWKFIFHELKRKSRHAKKNEGKKEDEVKAVWTARGEWAIKDSNITGEKREKLLDYAHPDKVAFDESLLLWHIATTLCYYGDGDSNEDSKSLEDGGGPNRDNTSHGSGGPNTGTSHDGDRNTSTSKSNNGICLSRTKLASWWKGDPVSDGNIESDKYKLLSKLLSDYMLYLSVMEPNVMSPVAGIGQLRFQDTRQEAINFFKKRLEEGEEEAKKVWLCCWPKKKKRLEEARKVWLCCWPKEKKSLEEAKKVEEEARKKKVEEEAKKKKVEEEAKKDGKEAKERKAYEKACERLINVRTEKKPLEVKGDRSKSLLFDGCMLAKELKKLDEKKWEVTAKVWVELLSFGASNCRTDAVVQQLSKGGELISFVWLLMVQLGLGTQFQIKEGHARAKLIVGDEAEEGTATAKSEGV